MDSARGWLHKFQSSTKKKKSGVSEDDEKKEATPLTEEEASEITKKRVAAAKQYIENHYKEQMENLHERFYNNGAQIHNDVWEKTEATKQYPEYNMSAPLLKPEGFSISTNSAVKKGRTNGGSGMKKRSSGAFKVYPESNHEPQENRKGPRILDPGTDVNSGMEQEFSFLLFGGTFC